MMINDNEVKFIKLDKRMFYSTIACQLDLLVNKYRYYYPGVLVSIDQPDIAQYAINKSKKHTRKFILYYDTFKKVCYLIQYSKKLIKIFYTNICYNTAKKYNKKLNEIYKFIIEYDDGM